MAFDPISTVLDIGGKILDRVIPDTNAREKAKQDLEKAINDQDFQIVLAQLAVNAKEAESENIFKSGWRPFVGWTCGVAFALHFVGIPLCNVILVGISYKAIVIPFDMGTLMTVLGGLLGLGGMRTYEKINAVK